MDLGATQQTQEKPGNTVTFPSAVIIPLKTSVSLSYMTIFYDLWRAFSD